MAKQRARRLANRGKRRPPLLTAHPWWWDYDRISATLNPYQLDWYTLRTLPALNDQHAYAVMAERLKDQIIGALVASGSFRRVN